MQPSPQLTLADSLSGIWASLHAGAEKRGDAEAVDRLVRRGMDEPAQLERAAVSGELDEAVHRRHVRVEIVAGQNRREPQLAQQEAGDDVVVERESERAQIMYFGLADSEFGARVERGPYPAQAVG